MTMQPQFPLLSLWNNPTDYTSFFASWLVLYAEVLHMTLTLKRQIISGASNSPQGTVHSPRRLPLLLRQLHSSGGRLSGDRRRSSLLRAGRRSRPEEASQTPQEGTLPVQPEGSSNPELDDSETGERRRELQRDFSRIISDKHDWTKKSQIFIALQYHFNKRHQWQHSHCQEKFPSLTFLFLCEAYNTLMSLFLLNFYAFHNSENLIFSVVIWKNQI